MSEITFQCSACGQSLLAPDSAAGAPVECPSCQAEVEVPLQSQTTPQSTAAPSSPGETDNCSFCHTPVTPPDTPTACPSCHAIYHPDCWEENGGCAVYGCEQSPEVEGRQAIEIPVSYWGQENKPCPNCGEEILAAAVRCRHCGATFSSTRPEDSEEFNQRESVKARMSSLKTNVTVLFVLCLIPCCAPLGAISMAIWYSFNRQDVKQMPAIYNGLCTIGLLVSIIQTVLIAIATFLYHPHQIS